MLNSGKEVSPLQTNEQFAQRVGIHHSMASRIRSGDRLPSLRVIKAISDNYGIPMRTLVDARLAGAATFSEILRRRVFKDPPTVAVAVEPKAAAIG